MEETTSHLARIEASAGFARSERLMRFLRYIVMESQAGRGERLKEYTIAIEVFGRPASYDPQVDSLVRVQASQLRTRLRQYYESEGNGEALRIEIPKGGYEPVISRVGPAPEPEPAPAPARRRLGGWVAGAAVCVVLMAGLWIFLHGHPRSARADASLSLAVLPFTDMSPARDQAYLCEGIAEELIGALGRVHGLRVVARTSAFQYKGGPGDVRRIGQELNVGSVLEGSVRRDGANLRVTAELIDAAGGYNVWSAAYDRKLDDTFAVERQIAQAIAAKLQPREGTRAERTPDPEAHRHYLTGIYWRETPTAERLRKAIAEFQAATKADPGYAAAEAALAEAYAKLNYLEIGPRAETANLARAAVVRALELDDHLARAHDAAALMHLVDWDPGGAEREYRRAIELDPSDVRIRHAYAQLCLNPARRHEEAAEQLRYALNFDPVNINLITELGATYLMAGQVARAKAEFRRSLEFMPQALGTRTWMAYAEEQEGHYAEAVSVIEKTYAEMPGDPWIAGHMGYAYAKAGQTAAARRVVADMLAIKAGAAMHIAAVYAGLEEWDKAMDWLERGVDAHSPSMYWLPTDYRFVPLHGKARYVKLAARLP